MRNTFPHPLCWADDSGIILTSNPGQRLQAYPWGQTLRGETHKVGKAPTELGQWGRLAIAPSSRQLGINSGVAVQSATWGQRRWLQCFWVADIHRGGKMNAHLSTSSSKMVAHMTPIPREGQRDPNQRIQENETAKTRIPRVTPRANSSLCRKNVDCVAKMTKAFKEREKQT